MKRFTVNNQIPFHLGVRDDRIDVICDPWDDQPLPALSCIATIPDLLTELMFPDLPANSSPSSFIMHSRMSRLEDLD